MRTQVRVRVLLEYPAGRCTEGVVTESQGPARPLMGARFGSRADPDRSETRPVVGWCARWGSRARPRPARPAASVAALVRFRPSAASGGLGGWSVQSAASLSRARRPLTWHMLLRIPLPVFFFPSGRRGSASPYAQYAQRWFLYMATFDMVIGLSFENFFLNKRFEN